MLESSLRLMKATGLPWICENVEGPNVLMDGSWFRLCGSMFGLKVRRHRRFGSSFHVLTPSCNHRAQGTPLGVYGNGGGGKMTRGVKATRSEAKEAMGIDWMAHKELSQAIPPAYTEYIGRQLIAAL